MKKARKSARSFMVLIAVYVSAMALLCSATAFAIPPSPFITQRATNPVVNNYLNNLTLEMINPSMSVTASGTLAGTATGLAINLSDENNAPFNIPGIPGNFSIGQNFNVGATFSVSALGVTLGPYGIVNSLDFTAAATAPTVNYNLPYSLNVQGIPASVSPGQTIPLDTTFDWGNTVITGTQSVRFSTTNSVWMDIPLDGLDATTIKTTHSPDQFLVDTIYSNATLTTTASIPPFPGLDSVELPGIPAPIGQSIDTSRFGVPATATLAGERNLSATGATVVSADVNSDHAYFGNSGSAEAWGVNGDLLTILAQSLEEAALAYPPAAVGLGIAAGAVEILNIPFSLPATIGIDIRRQDWMYVELAGIPSITISAEQALGLDQDLSFQNVPLTYTYMTGAYYTYDMFLELGVGVDLAVYDYNNTLFDIPLGSMHVGQNQTPLTTATSYFNLAINNVDVVASNSHPQFQAGDFLLQSLPASAFSRATGTGEPQEIIPGTASNIFSDPNPAPVPEPGTMMLLGSGLVGLVGYGRRYLKK